jgi:hypothetical protein
MRVPPTDADIARPVAAIARRFGRLQARRGLAVDADATDPQAAESLALAGLATAAVQGRLALGPRAGSRVERLGGDSAAPWIEFSRPLQARCARCDLHAGVTVAGEDRDSPHAVGPFLACVRLEVRFTETIALTAPALATVSVEGEYHGYAAEGILCEEGLVGGVGRRKIRSEQDPH